MRIALLALLVALSGCQNIHGQDAERCLKVDKSSAGFMACIVKIDRQRLAAWKAAHKPKPKEKPHATHRVVRRNAVHR